MQAKWVPPQHIYPRGERNATIISAPRRTPAIIPLVTHGIAVCVFFLAFYLSGSLVQRRLGRREPVAFTDIRVLFVAALAAAAAAKTASVLVRLL